MVVHTHSGRAGAPVIAVPGGEVHFVVGIVGSRMEGGQSRSTGAHPVDPGIQFVHFPAQLGDVPGILCNASGQLFIGFPDLAHIGRIRIRRARLDIGDLLAVGVQAVAGDVGLIPYIVFFRRDSLSGHSTGIAFDGHILQIDFFPVQAQFIVRSAAAVIALAVHLDVVFGADRGVLAGRGVDFIHPVVQPGHPVIQVVDGTGNIPGAVRIFQSIMELTHISHITGFGHIFDDHFPFDNFRFGTISGNNINGYPLGFCSISIVYGSNAVGASFDMLLICRSGGGSRRNSFCQLAFRGSFGGTLIAASRCFLVDFSCLPSGIAQIADGPFRTTAADHHTIGAHGNAVVLQCYAACLERSVRTQIDVLVQADFDMPIGICSRRFCSCGDISIPYNADGFAQYLGNFFILIVRQLETAGLGSQGHLLDGGSQLGFRSRPVLYIVGLVPGCIVQTGDVIPFIGAYPVFLFADDQTDRMSVSVIFRSKGNSIHTSQIRLEPIGEGSAVLDQGQVVPGIEGYRISGRNLFVRNIGRFIRLAAAAGFSGSRGPVRLIDGFRHVLGGSQTILCRINGRYFAIRSRQCLGFQSIGYICCISSCSFRISSQILAVRLEGYLLAGTDIRDLLSIITGKLPAAAHLVIDFFQLGHIDCIGIICTFSNSGNLITAIIQASIGQFHRRLGLIRRRQGNALSVLDIGIARGVSGRNPLRILNRGPIRRIGCGDFGNTDFLLQPIGELGAILRQSQVVILGKVDGIPGFD